MTSGQFPLCLKFSFSRVRSGQLSVHEHRLIKFQTGQCGFAFIRLAPSYRGLPARADEAQANGRVAFEPFSGPLVDLLGAMRRQHSEHPQRGLFVPRPNLDMLLVRELP